MKGSLFPLGRPLRELEDRPRAGSMPRLQPRLWPAAVGVSWALRLPPVATTPQGQPEHKCLPTTVSPSLRCTLHALSIRNDIAGHKCDAPAVLGARLCSLRTCQPCEAGRLRAWGLKKVLGPGAGNLPVTFTSGGCGFREPLSQPSR